MFARTERSLLPYLPLGPKHITVVAEEDQQCVLCQPYLIQRSAETPHAVIQCSTMRVVTTGAKHGRTSTVRSAYPPARNTTHARDRLRVRYGRITLRDPPAPALRRRWAHSGAAGYRWRCTLPCTEAVRSRTGCAAGPRTASAGTGSGRAHLAAAAAARGAGGTLPRRPSAPGHRSHPT